MSGVGALPDLAVDIGGRRLSDASRVRLSGLRVLRALSAPAIAVLVFEGGPPDEPTPFGATLRVSRADRRAPLFEGIVTAAELDRRGGVARRFAIRGADALHLMRRRGGPGALRDVTPADIARGLAGAYGLGFEASETGPTLPLVIRSDRTDLGFLLRETRRFGLWFHVEEGVLRLHGLDGAGGERVTLSLLADAIESRVEANADAATGSISFSAWSPADLASFPGYAFGLDSDGAFGASGGSADDDIPTFDLAAASADEALDIATAEMARRDAGRVTLRALFDGARSFALGERIEATDLGFESAGAPTITRIEERIDAAGGHLVEISTAPPPEPRHSPALTLVWGRVVGNDDPDGAGRVRVVLPAHGEVETGWIAVARPMTGEGRGFAFSPAVGDDLALLCPEGRAEHAIAVGALNGSRRTALDSVAGSDLRFGLFSGGGHRLVFDDAARSVSLEAADGSRWSMDRDGVKLSAAGDLMIEAPGGRILMRAARIDFEKED